MKKVEIENILRGSFSPKILEVHNDSEQHKGHAGYSDGETHFRIEIDKESVEGSSRLAKHKNILNALGNLPNEIHSIQIIMK